MWLPRRFIKPGTSPYVQGVEVPADYEGEIPEGFDVMALPACRYLMFQGEPFAEEDYCQAIEQVQEGIKKYDPSVIGYQWIIRAFSWSLWGPGDTLSFCL